MNRKHPPSVSQYTERRITNTDPVDEIVVLRRLRLYGFSSGSGLRFCMRGVTSRHRKHERGIIL